MNRRIVTLASLFWIVSACQSADDLSRSNQKPDYPMTYLPPEVREGLERYLSERANGLDYGNFLTCKEYLTDVESENYCSSEVPSDWVPFEYDGETYYIQPLAKGKQ